MLVWFPKSQYDNEKIVYENKLIIIVQSQQLILIINKMNRAIIGLLKMVAERCLIAYETFSKDVCSDKVKSPIWSGLL